MVVVEVFDNPTLAHLARIRLEGGGIEAHVFDENILTVDPLLGPAVGGVKLSVSASDAQAATALLAVEPENAREDSCCPRCGAKTIREDRSGQITE